MKFWRSYLLFMTSLFVTVPVHASPVKSQAPMIFIGGGKDQTAIFEAFIRLSGGPDVPFVIVPIASTRAAESGPAYAEELTKLKCANVSVFLPTTLDDPKSIRLLASARGIFFSGGDQEALIGKLTPSYRAAILQARKNGAVIAGTSAGAMIWGSIAILGGDPMETAWYGENPDHNGIKLGAGLGMLPNLIVDTHFGERGRLPRLAYAIAKHPGTTGIGVDPQTAAILYGDGRLEVLGRGTVTVVEMGDQKPTLPLSLRDAKIQFLFSGDQIQLPNFR